MSCSGTARSIDCEKRSPLLRTSIETHRGGFRTRQEWQHLMELVMCVSRSVEELVNDGEISSVAVSVRVEGPRA